MEKISDEQLLIDCQQVIDWLLKSYKWKDNTGTTTMTLETLCDDLEDRLHIKFKNKVWKK